MDALTVSQAAARTGWSARMLRYLELHALVVPRRTRSGYRLYGLGELNQLYALGELRRRVCAATASCAVPSTDGSRRPPTPAPGSSGSSASTNGCWRPDRN